jgi:hypothetical protein
MACHVWRGGPMPAAGHGQLGQAAHGWRWAQARAPRTKFFLTQTGKKPLTARGVGRGVAQQEFYPESYSGAHLQLPELGVSGGPPALAGRSAVRAHPPAIRAACACLSLVLPGAQAHAAMQRRGAVEGGGPRTEQRRNHTSRQDRLWTGRPIGSRLRGAVSPRRRLRAVLPCCADEQQPGRRAGRHNLSRLWTPRRRCSTRPRPHSPPARA